MSLFDAARFRFRSLFRSRRVERERSEEIAFHHSLAALDKTSTGSDQVSANWAARREFGNATRVKEETRHLGALRWVDAIAQDLRYGNRTLLRSPVFTTVAVLSLALGIGATTAIFGVLYAVMLRPVAVPDPQELVALQHGSNVEGAAYSFADGEYRALRAAAVLPITAFTYAAARGIEVAGVPLERGVETQLVDGAYFALLRVQPLAGRLLGEEDVARASPVVVISAALAESSFGSAQAALGKPLRMNDMLFSIVGVMPREFRGLNFPGNLAIAAPLSIAELRREARGARRAAPVTLVARVRPNDFQAAQAAFAGLFASCCGAGQYVAGERPNAAEQATLTNISRGIPLAKLDLREQYGRVLAALMGGVALLLLIVCANVGNLLLARAMARVRELAVRLSLGAARQRLVRQLLIESGILAAAGAAVGVVVAVWGTRAIAHFTPPNVIGPIGLLLSVGPQPQLLAFSAAVAALSTGIFGVLPAVRATRIDPVAGLRDSGNRAGRRTGRLDRAIVAVQVALALLLVSCAALLVRTLRNLRNIEGGFDAVHLVIANVETRDTPYSTLRPHSQEMLRRVRALPGIRSAGLGSTAPLIHGGGSTRLISVPGYEPAQGEDMTVHVAGASPGYFSAAGIGLINGREFAAQDGPNAAPVAIISEKVARRYFAGHAPVGALIRFGDETPRLVVGVVSDVKYFDLRAPAEASVYVPMEQWEYWDYFILVAQATGDAPSMTSSVREAIASALPGVNVRGSQAIAQVIDDRLVRERLTATLATLFGSLALLLAAIGLYGVMAYQVTARTAEIGVRMALGSRAQSAMWLVLRESLVVVAVGALAGVPIALGGARIIAAQLYGVSPTHLTSLLGSVAVLFGAGVVSSAVPARRAARVDPLVAMRSE